MSPPPAHGFRTFVFLWASQSLVVLASFVIYFASTIWLAESRFPNPAEKPELAFALAATAVAFMLPLLLAPMAGAWAVNGHLRTGTFVGHRNPAVELETDDPSAQPQPAVPTGGIRGMPPCIR